MASDVISFLGALAIAGRSYNIAYLYTGGLLLDLLAMISTAQVSSPISAHIGGWREPMCIHMYMYTHTYIYNQMVARYMHTHMYTYGLTPPTDPSEEGLIEGQGAGVVQFGTAPLAWSRESRCFFPRGSINALVCIWIMWAMLSATTIVRGSTTMWIYPDIMLPLEFPFLLPVGVPYGAPGRGKGEFTHTFLEVSFLKWIMCYTIVIGDT